MDEKTTRVPSPITDKRAGDRNALTRRVWDTNATRRVPVPDTAGVPGTESPGAGSSRTASSLQGGPVRPFTSGGRVMPLGALAKGTRDRKSVV